MSTGRYTDKISHMCEKLDRKLGKDWPFKIDMKSLDVNTTSNCVLGQLFDGYTNGYRALNKIGPDELVSYAESWEWGKRHAVWPDDVPGESPTETGKKMQRLWEKRILHLREKRKEYASID